MAQAMTRPGPQPIRKRPKQWPFPLNIYQSAVGRKWVMAVSGLVLLGFVVTHMIGNLHLYEGPLEIHEYAETLRKLGVEIVPRTWLLWAIRLLLIVAFIVHIHAAYTLAGRDWNVNSRSNPLDANKSYVGGQQYVAANYASRTMRWTGPIVLLYLFFHLADLTWGWLSDDWVRGDPYNNVVVSMGNVGVAIIYIVANIALAIHIFHGTYSLFQSLGVNSPKINSWRRPTAVGLAGLILVGNLSFPIAVQAGLIDQDGCEAPCGLTEAEEKEAEE
ncbi:MAG: succinate dehydrogenase cytochrome b subunit [Acidimicrobiales bacterium]